jgi:hypothetical protein
VLCEADVLLYPETQYYLWVFPGFSNIDGGNGVWGWVGWSRSLEIAVTLSGAAGLVYIGNISGIPFVWHNGAWRQGLPEILEGASGEIPDGVLVSSDGYILRDCNGVYLCTKVSAEAYRYGDVVLPPLPESDFPYVYIYSTGLDLIPYGAVYSENPPIWNGRFMSFNGMIGRWHCDTTPTWFDYSENDYTDSFIAYPAIWTNHDILDENGNLHLAASDPVPIYE